MGGRVPRAPAGPAPSHRNSALRSGVLTEVSPRPHHAIALPAPKVRATRETTPAYHRLIGLVLALNAGVVGFHLERADWHLADGSALSAFATLTLVNLAVAVLIRSQYVLNGLFALAGRAPRALRRGASDVHHVGG